MSSKKRVTWAPGPLKGDGGPRPAKRAKDQHPLFPRMPPPPRMHHPPREEKRNDTPTFIPLWMIADESTDNPFAPCLLETIEIPPTPKGLEHLVSD